MQAQAAALQRQARAATRERPAASRRSGHAPPHTRLQVWSENQEVTFEYQGTNYLLRVNTVMSVDEKAEQRTVPRGLLIAETAFVFETKHGSGLKITGQRR